MKGFPSLETRLQSNLGSREMKKTVSEKIVLWDKSGGDLNWLLRLNNEDLIIQNVWKNTCSQSQIQHKRGLFFVLKSQYSCIDHGSLLWDFFLLIFLKRINLFDRASKEIKTLFVLIKLFVKNYYYFIIYFIIYLFIFLFFARP